MLLHYKWKMPGVKEEEEEVCVFASVVMICGMDLESGGADEGLRSQAGTFLYVHPFCLVLLRLLWFQSRDVHIRLIGRSKLSRGVSCDELETCPVSTPPSSPRRLG